MFRLSKSARNSLLAILAVLALFASRNRGAKEVPPVAYISSHSQPVESDPEPTPAVHRPDQLEGDLSLRGQLQMDKITLHDGHYQVPLTDGSTAVLTLDPTLQEAAIHTLAKAKAPMGAIVVMRTDGTIVALAGQNNTSPELSRNTDYDLPLSVWAPAASVFKVVTATALVDSGLSPKSKVCYHGGIRSIDKTNLTDNSRMDTACNNLGFALAKSQNALIAKLVHKHLPKAQLASMASNFGFGTDGYAPFALELESAQIDLPNDPLEYARVASGFWHTELSPLGGALVANLIASGGLRVTPRIVAEVREKERTIPVTSVPPVRVLKEKTARVIGELMEGTVRFGTAYKGFHDKRGQPLLKDIEIAGKTGSLSRTTPTHLAYSWFVGFAPAEDPDLVIAVLLGNEAMWHLKGHTAARLVLNAAY